MSSVSNWSVTSPIDSRQTVAFFRAAGISRLLECRYGMAHILPNRLTPGCPLPARHATGHYHHSTGGHRRCRIADHPGPPCRSAASGAVLCHSGHTRLALVQPSPAKILPAGQPDPGGGPVADRLVAVS